MSIETAAKKIGTHSGKFHCDEAFACWMLKQLDDFRAHQIVRSREPTILSGCDVVVDVGGVFDHANKRYDHHQKEFNETMTTLDVLPGFETRLSSAGLVYAHYGKRIIAKLTNSEPESELVTILFRRLYERYVEAVDAVDNGVSPFDGPPRYHIGGSISARVGHLNPNWNDDESVNEDERFSQAMQLVGSDFADAVNYLYKVWWPARQIVEDCVAKRFEVDASGKILELSTGAVPWKEHFFDVEEKHNLGAEKITYIVYGDRSGSWRVQAIPTDRKAIFENRKPLPWKGLRDEQLSKEAGIEGGVFVHVTGFIGGAKTRDATLEMARKALAID